MLGLWRIQFHALSRYLDGTRNPAQVHQAVTGDVRRAACLIDTGLNSLPTLRRGRPCAGADLAPVGRTARAYSAGRALIASLM